MESTTLLSSSAILDTMSSSDFSEPHNFVKMEDLHASSPQSNSESNDVVADTLPAPLLVHSRPAKKRKSWGQELPEPKTALPPRKRAKTEDEKEQRRIERIKRNRAAAHNSRERKRQETDTLAVALARANAELDAYRRLHGPLPSTVVLPEVTLITESADTPAPSLSESRGSYDASASPATVTDDLFDQPIVIKQEPDTYPNTHLQPIFESISQKPASLQLFDLTQHSAEMLCDLPCRSKSSSSRQTSTHWWAAFFLYLTTLQLQATWKTLVLTIWTLSPSRTARLIQASTARLTSRSMTSSMTPLQSHSTLALAQRNAATATVSMRRNALEALSQRWSTLMQAHLNENARTAAAKQHQTRPNNSDMTAFKESIRDSDNEGKGGDRC